MNGLVSATKTDIGYSIVPRCVTTGTFTEANTRQIAIGCEGIGFEKFIWEFQLQNDSLHFLGDF